MKNVLAQFLWLQKASKFADRSKVVRVCGLHSHWSNNSQWNRAT